MCAGYDEEARYFEAGVRSGKRAELVDSLHAAVRPLYEAQLTALCSTTLAGFVQALAAALAERSDTFALSAAR